MARLRTAGLSAFVLVTLLMTALLADSRSTAQAESGRCTMLPGAAQILLRVERDTTLAFVPGGAQPMSMSGVPPSAEDSLVATPGTPMPAGRVRVLDLDSTTRVALAVHGIIQNQPGAFVRAAPYRADCRTVRWTDSVPFVERGEIGYVRGTLAPRDQWVGSAPVFIVNEVWNYPYPRRRGLAFDVASNAPLAPADAMHSLSVLLERPRTSDDAARGAAGEARRASAIDWAHANPVAADLEPVRTLLRGAILEPDRRLASRTPSRLRGTYRVDLTASGERHTWFFRTYDRPTSFQTGGDSLQTTAELLASPYVSGSQLISLAAGALDSLPTSPQLGPRRPLRAWLDSDDRPTTPDNEARRTLKGILHFQLSVVPEQLWDVLDPLIPRRTPADSAMMARMNIPRSALQPRVALTIHLDERGGIRADTTFPVDGGRLRLVVERLDTLSYGVR